MSIENIRALLMSELREIYAAEQRLLQALPAFVGAVDGTRLRDLVEGHLVSTDEQIARLDQIFQHLAEAPEGRVSVAVEAMIDEAQRGLQQGYAPRVMDLVLIAAMQKMVHYQIAAYGTLGAYASLCGLDAVHDLLDQSLAEERALDTELTRTALHDIQVEAPDCAADPG
jgi:ferritin-like metal-binding protein YciE